MTNTVAIAVAAGLLAIPGATLRSQNREVPCDPGNGGLSLPSGFCATVFADGIGALRHVAVSANGDVLVNTDAPGAVAAGSGGAALGGVVLLRDTNADGKAELVRRLGGSGGAGIAIANGFLYATTTDAVVRWKYAPGMTALGVPDTVISGFHSGGNAAWNFVVAGEVLYLNVGSLTNSCQEIDRQPLSKGVDPCLELLTRGGIWEYEANRTGQTVDVLFERRSRSLGETVRTGTVGATTRREVGNAVASVDASRDSSPSSRRLPDAIGSRVAGVTVLRNDGSVGAGASIRMRGINSFRQGNRPLFFVDGVRVFNDLLPSTVAQQSSSPLDDISPGDIDRIEIIKGAAATALYGTEASNGVVHVFTKNGSSAGQAQWSVKVTEGSPVPPPQLADGNWFATGIRNAAALAVDPRDGTLWAAVTSRGQLSEEWGFPAGYGAENPGGQVSRVQRGDDFGWPYCYYSTTERRLVDAPEYGGDGRKSDRCAEKQGTDYLFPAGWAPSDMLFYSGKQFPPEYSGGAFIAFQGAENLASAPRQGVGVAFLPVSGGRAGPHRIFADGFVTDGGTTTGSVPRVHRPGGIAQAPDGSIYVADAAAGTIWKISYRGTPRSSTPESPPGDK